MNQYVLSVKTSIHDNKIEFFELFDFIKNLVYYGGYQIKDASQKINYDEFLKIKKNNRRTLIPINESQLNIFLNLNFYDLKEMTFKDFVIKYGVEEYAI